MSKIKNKKDKYLIGLIVLTVFGFFLRLIASLNLDVFADDMLYASQSAGIIKSGILSTHSNPPLFFYLTDLAYNIFGYTTFASRFWPLIAGTLLIPLVFYITHIFTKDKKISLLSAFFVAFSAFLVRMTFTEQSLLVLFFITFALFAGLKYLYEGNNIWVYLFGASFGLASLTKYSAPFFFIAFALFTGYLYEKEKDIIKNFRLNKILLVLGIILFFSLPFLIFNILIYRENGILDVYFSRIIQTEKTQQLYGSLAGQGDSFFDRLSNLGTYSQYKLTFITDPIITILGLLGLFFLFKRKKYPLFYFIIIMLIVPFILQSAGSGLQKHFAFIPLLLAIPAAIGLTEINDKLKSRTNKLVLIFFIIIGLVICMGTNYGTPTNLLSSSSTSELKSFINEKVKEDNLIIIDSRIYSARSFWLATPNSFVLSSQLKDIYAYAATLPAENLKPVGVYYIECALDDCGWGNIQNDQNLNQTTEQINKIFKENGIFIGSISARDRTSQEFLNPGKNTEVYKVYYLNLNLPEGIIAESKKWQNFYFTPYLYENMDSYIFNYEAQGVWKFIEYIGKLTIYLAMILSISLILLFILTTIRELIKKTNNLIN